MRYDIPSLDGFEIQFETSAHGAKDVSGYLHVGAESWAISVGAPLGKVHGLNEDYLSLSALNTAKNFQPKTVIGKLEAKVVSILDARLKDPENGVLRNLFRYDFNNLVVSSVPIEWDSRISEFLVVIDVPVGKFVYEKSEGSTYGISFVENQGFLGVRCEFDRGPALKEVVRRYIPSVQAFYKVFAGWDVQIAEIHFRDVGRHEGRVYSRGLTSEENAYSVRGHSKRIPLANLTPDALKSWMSSSIGLSPIPFICEHGNMPIQALAQLKAVALEGVFDRIHPDDIWSIGLTRSMRKKIINNALIAGMEVVDDSLDPQMEELLSNSPSSFNKKTYAQKMRQLFEESGECLPLLRGDQKKAIIDMVKEVRNIQSHSNSRHDNFVDEDLISKYCAVESLCSWVMRIVMMRLFFPDEVIRGWLLWDDALEADVANIDADKIFPEDFFTRSLYSWRADQPDKLYE